MSKTSCPEPAAEQLAGQFSTEQLPGRLENQHWDSTLDTTKEEVPGPRQV
ncbi:hypothetical protein KLP40_14370 [Hymenobacter sp. NST-14]|nr:hypothetical protein [Hymenobacter piscis]MBT9394352.1 hypothetical protein [Hymenobacter piscis]